MVAKSKPNEYNLSNVKCETSRTFRGKNGNIWKTKLMSHKETVRIKNTRRIQRHK
jgi:hypothetical protein